MEKRFVDLWCLAVCGEPPALEDSNSLHSLLPLGEGGILTNGNQGALENVPSSVRTNDALSDQIIEQRGSNSSSGHAGS
jgi:hypothetical protein